MGLPSSPTNGYGKSGISGKPGGKGRRVALTSDILKFSEKKVFKLGRELRYTWVY